MIRAGRLLIPWNPGVALRGLLSGVLSCLSLGCADEVNRIQGVTIVPTDIVVRTQADLDLLAGVTEVRGRLAIGPSYGDPGIHDLGALRQLERVEELVILDCPGLQTLEGLSALTAAGDVLIADLEIGDLTGLRNLRSASRFELTFCNELRRLDGLGALENVDRYLSVRWCESLEDLGGLSHLQSVGQLRLGDLPLLRSLEGAPRLTNVGQFELHDLPLLRSLVGLESVTSPTALSLTRIPLLASLAGMRAPVRHLDVSESALTEVSGLTFADSTEWIAFTDNGLLRDLSGLSGIPVLGGLLITLCPAVTSLDTFSSTRIQEHLTVTANTGLRDLHGMEATTTLASLDVSGNAILESLAGLENLERVGNVTIRDNESLCESAVLAWSDSVTVSGRARFGGNARCAR